MSKAATFTEALSTYLSGDEWQQSVNIFVRNNCPEFYDVDPDSYGHEHHGLWKTYQDIVENILEMALQIAGGSLEGLEKALDEVKSVPSRGPKEDSVKEILDKLLTFDDFDAFAVMMADAADELARSGGGAHRSADNPYHHERARRGEAGRVRADEEDEGSTARGGGRGRGHSHGSGHSEIDSDAAASVNYSGGGSDHRASLLGMGFDEELVDLVLAGCDQGTDIGELVLLLSDMQAKAPTATATAGGASATAGKQQQQATFKRLLGVDTGAGLHASERELLSPQPKVGGGGGGGGGGGTREAAAAVADGGREGVPHLRQFAADCGSNVGDWNELNARFVTARSLLDTFIDGDVSDGIVVMVQWATDMVELYDAIEACFKRGSSMKAPTDKRPAPSQNGLVGWYYELEDARKDLQGPQNAFNTLLSDNELQRMAELDRIAEMGTSDEQLLHSVISRHDEVHKDINLLHRRCGALCGPGSGVKRETVEELYLYLKEKVSEAGDLAAVADEMHEHVYTLVDSAKGGDIINVLLEMHILEDEQRMLRQKIDSLLGSPVRADAKDTGGVSMFGSEADTAAQAKSARDSFPSLDSKDSKGQAAAFRPGQANGGAGRGGDGDGEGPRGDVDEEALGAHVKSLKHMHKKSLDELRMCMDKEKARKMQALEERLLRRKRAGEKELAAAKAAGASDAELKTLAAQLRAAENELDVEMQGVEEQFEANKAGVCNGFKKRCIYEVKATEARGKPLSPEEIADSHREAAEALKSRFFRDNKALQESLEAERAKSRRAIMHTLEKRRRDAAGNAEALRAVEQDAKEAMEDMDLDFEGNEQAALSGPQNNILMSLAGIFTDMDVVLHGKGSKGTKGGAGAAGADDEDDDYFNDDGAGPGQDHANARAWSEGISNLRKIYVDAGQSLQRKMRKAYQQGEGDVTDASFEGSFGAVAQHMTQVITNAYNAQLCDPETLAALVKGQKGAAAVDADRVKASILEEFEKSRGVYEEALESARLNSKAKLERRQQRNKAGRDGRSGATAGQDGKDGDNFEDEDEADFGAGSEAKASTEWGTESIRIKKTQGLLEEAVDSFLEDPIVVSRGGASTMAYANKFDASKFTRRKVTAPQQNLPPVQSFPAAGGADSVSPQRAESKASSGGSAATAAQEHSEFLQFQEHKENQRKKDAIKNTAAEREKQLIDQLTVEMQKKKFRLEERLRRKRDARGAGGGSDGQEDMFGTESETLDAEEQRAQAELEGMEEAFHKAVSLLKRTDQARLNGVNVAQLVDVMDRFAKKENVASSSLGVGGAADTTPGGKVSPKTRDIQDLSAKMEEEDLLSWVEQEPLQTASHTKMAIDARNAMESEVHRISETYNEEKQKLDLMMKIQQARQKQVLQRKLLDRKQGQGISQGMLRGAGYADTSELYMVTGGLGKQLPSLSRGAADGAGAGAGAGAGSSPLPRISSGAGGTGLHSLAAAGSMGMGMAGGSPNKVDAGMVSRGLSMNNLIRK